MDLHDFVLAQLSGPSRVLEIGCGEGELALALAGAGHEVTAIDPEAPAGPIFRRVTLEEFAATTRFDAVIASRSLHHVHDVAAGLDKIGGLLETDGVLVLDEFVWDRLDDATADWYYGQLRALAASGQKDEIPPSLEACLQDWRKEHTGLHGFAAMRAELDSRFSERLFEWRPYIYRYLGGVVSEALERALIDAGVVQALGFRYVGEVRTFPHP